MLKGSEKQIKWANEIKEDMILCVSNLLIASDDKFSKMEMPQASRDNLNIGIKVLEEILENLKLEDSAKWFIDKKEYLGNASIMSLEFDKLQDYKILDVRSLFKISSESIEAKSIKVIIKNTVTEYAKLF